MSEPMSGGKFLNLIIDNIFVSKTKNQFIKMFILILTVHNNLVLTTSNVDALQKIEKR